MAHDTSNKINTNTASSNPYRDPTEDIPSPSSIYSTTNGGIPMGISHQAQTAPLHPNAENAPNETSRISPNSLATEKPGVVDIKEPQDITEQDPEIFAEDPFKPFDNLPDERHNVLTFRAMFIGLVAGAFVNASNVFLGLKSGWTFGASLFGAIVGFGLISLCARFLAQDFPILGGRFGPRENNIVQTAATASGGMSNVFVSAFPAMYQLGLLGKSPKEDYWKLVAITAVGGYFGLFFATPLRKFFIIYVARELKLIFPTPMATAMTIRSMHDAVSGAYVGKMKMRGLLASFAGAFVLRVVSQYAPGILWEWHPFVWFYAMGHYRNLAIAVESWGWYLVFTPAFIGSGMLVGLNVSISFFAGSVLAWGVIGPILVHYNEAFGIRTELDDPHWHDLTNFASLGRKWSTRDTPSPRFWLLWPGVLAMIAISFTDLLLQWRTIWFAFKAVSRAATRAVRKSKPREAEKETDQLIEDPADPSELTKTWVWVSGLLLSIVGMCAVMGKMFDMPVGMSLLSVFLAFFFSFLAIQCTGVTDITPLTAASKASQIILGGATKSNNWGVQDAQRLNLLGGALANVGASQSTDLVSDFRVGFLLRTPPNQQFMAQAIGTVVAVFLAPLIFQLFGEAYPCILNSDIEKCPFKYPSVSAWKAVAVAATDPTLPIPKSSGIFAIAFAVFGSVMVIIRHYFWRGRLEWVRTYHPNMMCIALAFVLPQTFYGTAMVIGAIWAQLWYKRNPKSYELLCFAVAAGLIAGEGIGGVFNAILQVFGKSGAVYGTNVGCPKECD